MAPWRVRDRLRVAWTFRGARGVQAACLWLSVEVLVRRSGLPATQIAAMLILMLVFGRRVLRERLRPADLGYRWSRPAVVAGATSGVVLFAILLGTAALDRAVFDPGDDAGWPRRLADADPVAMLALVVGNGLLAPLVEEYAWRGYIQTRLVHDWGAATGLAATAAGFAAKHLLVDLSLVRLATLLVGSAALSAIAHRWGTAASTLAHAATNTAATLLVIVSASEWGAAD